MRERYDKYLSEGMSETDAITKARSPRPFFLTIDADSLFQAFRFVENRLLNYPDLPPMYDCEPRFAILAVNLIECR